jgi:selenocysteine lyase/cysteine desulfurase
MNWSLFRSEFPVTRRWAFLDHAAVAPLPARAQRALVAYAADVAENGVVSSSARLREVERVRGLAARLLNAGPLDVAFVKNTSEGIGIVAEGLPWAPGDNVVLAEDEYPANVYPWLNLAERGVEVRRVPARGPRVDPADLAAAFDARTRLLSLSFVQFATGFRSDLREIGELCRARGVLFFVDAIQGLGVFPVDVRAAPIDFLAADGHKWLLGPEGAGVLYVRRELVEQLHPVGVGWNSVVGAWDFSTIDFRLKPHAGRWESGSYNVAGILALGASLEVLLEVGTPALAERVLELTDHLCARAESAGLAVFSSRAGEERSGIVALGPPAGAAPAEVVRRLRGEGVIINHRAGRLRVSPHAYNTIEEVDRLVELLGGLR